MTKAETLAALKNQLDSFYSLEQVIKIIEGIDPDKNGNNNFNSTSPKHVFGSYITKNHNPKPKVDWRQTR